MAVTNEQKIDFLLKKIGFTKTKTGSVVGTGAISGTPKQPFAEAIPSPLVVPNSSLWNEAGSIPATAPGSDTPQVKVYLAGTSGLRMTADSTSSGQRAYIAYTTYNNTSSARLTNWIDTQFGASYLIKVYKGDPNSGGVALSAAGSGANDGWFFDYSAGVLNFNDSNVPSGVTDTNIYIVGYRYIGQTGAPTSGISTFSNLDLTVERNLDVGKQGGISTFRHNVQLLDNDKLQFGDSQDLSIYHDGTHHRIDGVGSANLIYRVDQVSFMNGAGTKAKFNLYSNGQAVIYHDHSQKFTTTSTGISITGNNVVSGNVSAVDATFSGNVSIGGTLTYEDVKNVDSVGIVTARSGIRIPNNTGKLELGSSQQFDLSINGSGEALINTTGVLNLATTSFRLRRANGSAYLMNADQGGGLYLYFNGSERLRTTNTGIRVGTGATIETNGQATFTGIVTATTFKGDGDFVDIDVDGHTNLDNVSVAGVTTFSGIIEGVAGENKIPSLYAAMGNLPSAGSYHGMFAHVHATGRGYFAHAGNWLELVNRETNGVVGTGTETYSIGNLVSTSSTATSLNVTGVTTAVTVDINGDLDVDGHTELDNVNVAGVTTFNDNVHLKLNDRLYFGNGNELEIYQQGNNSFIVNNDDTFEIGQRGQGAAHAMKIYGGTEFELRHRATNGGQSSVFKSIRGGAFTLYHAGGNTPSADQIRLETTSTGLNFPRDIDVDGHTNLDNVSIAGVTTFAANTRFNSSITAGGGTGSNGQYLKTTGSGVEWATFPSLRTRQTFTASAGQTTFSFNYTVNFLDVFVNGVKLTDSEFTATNGTSVVLAVGSFVGDIIELVSYNTVSAGGGAGGIGNLVEDTSPQLGGNLDLFNKSITGTGNVNITGIISATSFKGPSGVTATFIGDGSGLTGITASGTGIIIKHDNNSVGTAGTINFGTGLDVSAISGSSVTVGVTTSQFDINKLDVSGISTFKGAVDINADIDVDGHTNLDNVSIAGVATATTFVGALTGNATGLSGNPSINITDLDVDGHTNLDNISVAGVSTFTGAINASELSLTGTAGIKANSLNLKNAAGSATYATFTNGGSAVLKHNNTDRLETTASGVTVTGTVAATSYTGDGSNLTGISAGSTAEVRANTLNVIGVSTFAGALDINNNVVIDGNIDLNGDIDVDGHTNLDNISVAGVSTFDQGVTFQSQTVHLDGLRIGTAATISSIGNATYTGIITAQKFIGDGSGLTGVTGSGTGIAIKNSGSIVGTAGTINFGDNLSVSAISGGAVTITASGGGSGISTISGVVNIANDLDVDGHTNLDNVSIAGIVTTAGGLNVSSGTLDVATQIRKSSGTLDYLAATHTFSNAAGSTEYFRFASSGQLGIAGANYGTSGQVLTSGGSGAAASWTTISSDVGITTSLSGSFTASAGTAATINTLTGYSANDLVVEYTIYIKNGSDFQSQKLLAMRDGTTIHSTQFAVMYSSSLLVQCDATISSGNILLRATPETGVSGSTTYKIKREVM